MEKLYVINARGEREPFSFRKVYASAKRAGASTSFAKDIAREIENTILPGASTSLIYERVKKTLYSKTPEAGIKFSLKEGMRKLGPTGFPFEKYIGRIFQKAGFSIMLNQHVTGFCCRYEIDFLARKQNTLALGECKYHSVSGQRVDLKEALANYARFLDIKEKYEALGFKKVKSLMVTNTKFTTEAIKYCRCVGVEILGWKYPPKKGLEHIIETERLYPITILPSFKKNIADFFASNKIMLAEDVLAYDEKKLAKISGIKPQTISALFGEAKSLLGA